MIKKGLVWLLSIGIYATALAQADSLSAYRNLFGPPKDTVNILYYHFAKGLQMVELDFESPYWQKINYYEMRHPSAMPYTSKFPRPQPNIYLFRDTMGKVLKSYNLKGRTIKDLRLKDVPGLTHKQMVYHQSKNFFEAAAARKYRRSYSLNHFALQPDAYLITEGGNWGLIDTFGNVILKPVYSYIEPFELSLTVAGTWAGKQGLIDHHGKEVVPCRYDRIVVQENVYIATLDKKQSVYNAKGKKISRREYDGELLFDEGTSRYFVKGKGYGIIDSTGKEITRPVYEFIEELSQNYFKGSEKHYSASKREKELYLSQRGKERYRKIED